MHIFTIGIVASSRNVLLIPSSVLNLVTPASFTFSGSVLTSITDLIGSSTPYTIVGSPAEGVEGGYVMTEASGGVQLCRSFIP